MSEVSLSGPRGYPDILLAGAARSGTSFLAARMSQHPLVDGGAIKEPNYFSRFLERGPEWYDGLYAPRREGLLRMDASMTYTTPAFPDALGLVAQAAPLAKVIYAVRHPLVRAVSHYRLLSQYFSNETEATFGEAIVANPVYLGTSDYGHWIEALHRLWGEEGVLVVPFDVTTRGNEATDAVFAFLGLQSVELEDQAGSVQRNEVVELRAAWMRPLRKGFRHAPIYPWLRRRLGPDRMRKLRGVVTRRPAELSVEAAMASCTADQQAEIHARVERAGAAATRALEAQDSRLGLDWARVWRDALEGSSDPRPA